MEMTSSYDAYLESLLTRCLDYPATVSIETFVYCNAACDFCPYPQLERKGDLMSEELFEKIVKDLTRIPPSHRFDVNLSRVNEPFLDSRIFHFSQRINEELPQASLVFFSNGTPLNDGNIEKLRRLQSVNRLNISVNEHDATRYKEVMQLPFNRTLAALRRLHDADLPFPITLSRVGDGSSSDAAFVKWVENSFPRFSSAVSPRSDWLGLKPLSSGIQEIPDTGCSQWFKLHFLADGREAFCCIDGEGQWGEGNARTSHVLDIYNTEKRRDLRKAGLSRVAAGPLCAACPLLS